MYMFSLIINWWARKFHRDKTTYYDMNDVRAQGQGCDFIKPV